MSYAHQFPITKLAETQKIYQVLVREGHAEVSWVSTFSEANCVLKIETPKGAA